ncbi:MAG: Ig domain-containing protein [Candidatus Woesearchaeota archaeon]|nr:Ig domain-containing protein [Candidatus Woesearchaeota archaeon]
MNKKAQLAVFGVFIVVVLITMSFIMAPNKSPLEEAPAENTDTVVVKKFIHQCIHDTGKQGIQFLAWQGGYFTVEIIDNSSISFEIPYYWDQNKSIMPPIEVIELELAVLIKRLLPECLNQFKNIEDTGLEINTGEISPKVKFNQKDIMIELQHPITIKSAKTVWKSSIPLTKIDQNFKERYDIVREIMDVQEANPGFIPVGTIADLSEEHNFKYEIEYIGEEDIHVILYFIEPDLVYAYSARYGWDDVYQNKSVKIHPVEGLSAFPGYAFNHVVEATGNNVTFKDYTTLFDINPTTGAISFTPTNEQAGEHTIMIVAEDNQKNKDRTILHLNITRDNLDPIIQPVQDIRMSIHETRRFRLSATDPDQDILFFNVESSFDNVSIDTVSGEITISPNEPGNHRIKAIVSDPFGHIDYTYFFVEVEDE